MKFRNNHRAPKYAINLQNRHRWLVKVLGVATLVLPRLASAEQTAEEGYECSDAALSVAVDKRGRTLVAGTTYDNRVLEWESGHAHFGDFALARLERDGSIDRSFGSDGKWLMDLGDFDDLQEIASTRHGLVVAGTTANALDGQAGPSNVVVASLTTEGRPRRHFGNNGMTMLDIGGDDTVSGLVARRGGGVYVAGNSTYDGTTRGYVSRLTRRGQLDNRFGEHGVVRVNTGSENNEVLAIRKSLRGGVVVAGQTTTPTGTAAFVARVGRHCHADPEVSLVEVGGTASGGAAAFFDAAGRAYITLQHSGTSDTVTSTTVVFDPLGREISTAGAVVNDLPAGFVLSATAPLRKNRWYLSGVVYPEDYAFGDALLARVDTDAGLDPFFAGGLVQGHWALEYASFNHVAVLRDGVVAAGWDFSEQPESLPQSDALVARYTHRGELDPNFGDEGVVMLDFHDRELSCGPTQHIE